LALAAAAGAAVAVSRPSLASIPERAAAPAAAATAVVAATALAIPAGGFVRRHVGVAPQVPGAVVARWAVDRAGFSDHRPIYFAGAIFGQLAGDRLQHELVLLPGDTPCPAVRALVKREVLVVSGGAFARPGVKTPIPCVAGLKPVFEAPRVRVYGGL
jgi:hypothetical protein